MSSEQSMAPPMDPLFEALSPAARVYFCSILDALAMSCYGDQQPLSSSRCTATTDELSTRALKQMVWQARRLHDHGESSAKLERVLKQSQGKVKVAEDNLKTKKKLLSRAKETYQVVVSIIQVQSFFPG